MIEQVQRLNISNISTIPFSSIDREDTLCRLGWDSEPDPLLVEAIRAMGLLNPPLLYPKNDERYGIVCGFKRVSACSLLGWEEIPVRVFKNQPPDHVLIETAIWDNRSHRPLNTLEQSLAIQKLEEIGVQRDLPGWSHLLGMPPNKKVFEKIKKIAGLDHTIQKGLVDGLISFEAAVDLTTLKKQDALSLFALLKELRQSQNKEKEMILMVQEIAIREDLSPSKILQTEDIDSICKDKKMNRNEKGSRIRQYLKKRRFPALTQAEKKFQENCRKLALQKDISLTAPAFFEGDTYTLRLSFRSQEALRHRCREISNLSDHPAMKSILET